MEDKVLKMQGERCKPNTAQGLKRQNKIASKVQFLHFINGFVNELSDLSTPPIARCWWLTPVILATQEAEIRRTVVQSQPGQIVC
jgi:hypothetical protein